MGANAQIEVPAFTAGQILTAAEMTQINTGIPVFATTVTRDAAFGGAGEKVLAQGQYAYIEATSTLQVYTGAAWITAGASGLNLVTTATVGTAVASVTVTGAFNSTYDNYRIDFSGINASGSPRLRLSIGGSAGSTYNFAASRIDVATSSNIVETGALGTFWVVALTNSGSAVSGSVTLFNPNKVSTTQMTANSFGPNYFWTGGGDDSNAAASTAFTITPSTGTLTGGTIRVYGYQNS